MTVDVIIGAAFAKAWAASPVPSVVPRNDRATSLGDGVLEMVALDLVPGAIEEVCLIAAKEGVALSDVIIDVIARELSARRALRGVV